MPKSKELGRPTSQAQEDYLKAMHRLARAGKAVPTSELADELGVSSASVSEMLVKLSALKLITHDPYHGATLTPAGLKIAVEIVRHHRLLETYLVQALGYGWDEVHQEADRLEHSISERLEDRMWEALGKPAVDPHGDPIPARNGSVVEAADRALHQVPSGTEVRISRISDRDPEKLRAIERLGILPGLRIRVTEESKWEAPIELEREGTRLTVPLGLARAIFVEDVDG